jgi:hypothetical protein
MKSSARSLSRRRPGVGKRRERWEAEVTIGVEQTAGMDDREQRVCRQRRDGRYAWPSDSAVIEVAATLDTVHPHARRDRACSTSAAQLTRNVVAIAHIQAWAAWARHDCFGSRGCCGPVMPLPRLQQQ